MNAQEKECLDLAREIASLQYKVIDEIWKRRVSWSSVARDYDAATVREINRRMPNLLVKKGGVPLDELADEYGYACTCDLVDEFTRYTNKSVMIGHYFSQILQQYKNGASDVPF